MAAEYIATMYLLLMFLVFPLLNYAVTGMRAFFLWFACSQAVSTAAKCRTFFQPVTIGGVPYPGAYAIAQNRASQIRAAFPGIGWVASATNPEVDIVVTNINTQIQTVTIGPSPLGIGNAPDVSNTISSLRVKINGWVVPLIPIPWFSNIPGLGGNMGLLVVAEQNFENPPGLQY